MKMNRKTFLIFSRTHLDRHLNEIKRKETSSQLDNDTFLKTTDCNGSPADNSGALNTENK